MFLNSLSLSSSCRKRCQTAGPWFALGSLLSATFIAGHSSLLALRTSQPHSTKTSPKWRSKSWTWSVPKAARPSASSGHSLASTSFDAALRMSSFSRQRKRLSSACQVGADYQALEVCLCNIVIKNKSVILSKRQSYQFLLGNWVHIQYVHTYKWL